MKAKLTKLITEYENALVASTGRRKKEYIGCVGDIELKRYYTAKKFSSTRGWYDLYDIRFPDGALFCVEEEQLEIYED